MERENKMNGAVRSALREIIAPLPAKIAVSTSGGIDSSSLVAAALDEGKDISVFSFTFEDFESTDFLAAKKLAIKYSLPFVDVLLPKCQHTIYATVESIIAECRVKKKTAVECIFPFVFLTDKMLQLDYDCLLSGNAADGHFGLSKKAMIHFKEPLSKFNQFRQDYFSNKDSAQVKTLKTYCLNKGINLCTPYFEPKIFSLFINKTWDQLNKPRQKEAIRADFPDLDDLAIKPHSNLQMGDSRIAERVGAAALQHLPGAKNPVAVYNRIYSGQL
jgi:asparagine synthetase B (glutamine-hydrolysing)